MKANDIERKTNSLDFDKETEINGTKARFSQQKNLLKETIKENKANFEKDNFPLKIVEAEFAGREKELNAKKEHDILHAKLIFFFKTGEFYQVIPDDITARIIQGLGNRVFTKTFTQSTRRFSMPSTVASMPINSRLLKISSQAKTKMWQC